MYAKISSNTVINYPAFPSLEHPNVGFPENWLGGTVNGDEYVYVQPTEKPIANIGWQYTEGLVTDGYKFGLRLCYLEN